MTQSSTMVVVIFLPVEGGTIPPMQIGKGFHSGINECHSGNGFHTSHVCPQYFQRLC